MIYLTSNDEPFFSELLIVEALLTELSVSKIKQYLLNCDM